MSLSHLAENGDWMNGGATGHFSEEFKPDRKNLNLFFNTSSREVRRLETEISEAAGVECIQCDDFHSSYLGGTTTPGTEPLVQDIPALIAFYMLVNFLLCNHSWMIIPEWGHMAVKQRLVLSDSLKHSRVCA